MKFMSGLRPLQSVIEIWNAWMNGEITKTAYIASGAARNPMMYRYLPCRIAPSRQECLNFLIDESFLVSSAPFCARLIHSAEVILPVRSWPVAPPIVSLLSVGYQSCSRGFTTLEPAAFSAALAEVRPGVRLSPSSAPA